MLRVLFLGQKWLGERCFLSLMDYHNRSVLICGVVTNPRPDTWWGSNAIHTLSNEHGIPCLSNENRNTGAILDLMERSNVTTILSVQHPWILSRKVLECVDYRSFNIHNAKLPDYQGFNACNHSILNGDISFTTTLHWMADEVDRGDIIFESTFSINSCDTARSLYGKANYESFVLFRRLIDHLVSGIPLPRKQISGEGCFYPRHSIDSHRLIQHVVDPVEVDRKSRAFWFPPFEPAYFLSRGKKNYVLPASFFDENKTLRSSPYSDAPGTESR